MPSYYINKAVPGAREYYPLSEPDSGTPWQTVRLIFILFGLILTIISGRGDSFSLPTANNKGDHLQEQDMACEYHTNQIDEPALKDPLGSHVPIQR